jgi:Zn-dependent M28 family amino/carboxypeptidase
MKVQEHAQSKGCSLVIIANPTNPKQFSSISQQLSDYQNSTQFRISSFTPKSISRFFSRFSEPIPQIIISDDVAKVLLGEKPSSLMQKIEKSNASKRIPSEINVNFNYNFHVDTIKTHNVIGWLHADYNTQQNIIVCAHFDHLAPEGNRWYPGTDDNASGTAILIELARRFANEAKQGYKPKRNIVFAAFTAEEIGLLGSQHYSLNPLFPVDSTVIVLNFDMLGRMGKQEKVGNNLFIGGSNRINDFDQILNQFNTDTTITIDSESLSGSSLFTMSDHYYFENRGIPAYLITTGLHSDYHKPSDTAEKINYNELARIVNLSFDVIKHFADHPSPWIEKD